MIKSKIINDFKTLADEITTLVLQWEKILPELPEDVITQRRNSQNRSVKQIIGHMVDSASNNTHRTVHLQYRELPLRFPNYATYGNNEKWIAIQKYQEESWEILIQLWKYSNLHYMHVIQHIKPEMLLNEWISDAMKKTTLKEMVLDFPRHFKLHLSEIEELIQK